MKPSILQFIDRLTPGNIQQLGSDNEEKARARILVLLLLNNFVFIALTLLASLLADVSDIANIEAGRVGLLLGVVSYATALAIFQRTGLHVVSGNIYAFVCFTMIVATLVILPYAETPTFILHLLAIPMITALIANYASGIAWLGMIAVTPPILNALGVAEANHLSNANWMATCVAIFIAMYIGHYYREFMSSRLRAQNSLLEFAACTIR